MELVPTCPLSCPQLATNLPKELPKTCLNFADGRIVATSLVDGESGFDRLLNVKITAP